MVKEGDKVVCYYTGELRYDGWEHKPPVTKLVLNKVYIVNEVQDEGYKLVGFDNSYNKRRFMPLNELRKKKLECIKKATK